MIARLLFENNYNLFTNFESMKYVQRLTVMINKLNEFRKCKGVIFSTGNKRNTSDRIYALVLSSSL